MQDFRKFLTVRPGKSNESEVCKLCNGEACCQLQSCALMPGDVYLPGNYEFLWNMLMTGAFCIKEFKAHERIGGGLIKVNPFAPSIYYLKVRVKKWPKLYEPLDVGNIGNLYCCLWRDGKGCMLPFEKRPTEGRELIPMKIEKLPFSFTDCEQPLPLERIPEAWMPYQGVLKKLIYNLAEATPPFPEL